MPVQYINQLLTYLTLAGQIFLTAGLVLLLFARPRRIILDFLKMHGLQLAFIVSLVAALGSLFYSEVAGYAPCKLCWYQRIFMYPQVFLLGLAIYKKERMIIDYALLLLFLGAAISLYHNYIYYISQTASVCAVDALTSCTARYIYELGYITIPLMALTAFILVILLLYLHNSRISPR